jgi:DNA-binding protein H-NS
MRVKLGGLDIRSMSTVELWTLREEVGGVLSERILAEKRGLEERLARLDRVLADKARSAHAGTKTGQSRRPRRKYPPVLPKYQNPNDPKETWSGRGKQPRWLVSQINAGKKMSDFLINWSEQQLTDKWRLT